MSYEVSTLIKSTDSIEKDVTKEEFHKYLKVQYEGNWNMLSQEAQKAVGISNDKYLSIIKFYNKYLSSFGELKKEPAKSFKSEVIWSNPTTNEIMVKKLDLTLGYNANGVIFDKNPPDNTAVPFKVGYDADPSAILGNAVYEPEGIKLLPYNSEIFLQVLNAMNTLYFAGACYVADDIEEETPINDHRRSLRVKSYIVKTVNLLQKSTSAYGHLDHED